LFILRLRQAGTLQTFHALLELVLFSLELEAFMRDLLATSRAPAIRAEPRLKTTAKLQGLIGWETMSSAAFGGILFQARAAVSVKSFEAVGPFTIVEVVLISLVSVSAANFSAAASGE
jgi:hypothetical protein